MPFSLQDPRVAGSIMLALVALAVVAIPGYMMEVLLTVATSAVLAPGVTALRHKLRLSLGLTVALVSFAIIAVLGTGGYFGVPLFIHGISETLAQLPDSVRKIAPFVQHWLEEAKSRLEEVFPGDHNLDDLLKKLPEIASGSGGSAAKLALATLFGSMVTLGHFLLFLVLTAILSGEWEKNTERARHLIDLFAPNQRHALFSFGEKFQKYGVDLFLGIFTVMLIFMPIFVGLLYFYGGLSLGKSLLFGVVLGGTSAIPTVGGIITYLILVMVGLLNFGLGEEGLKKTLVLYLAAFAIHFAETKFVTPRVLGHRISFTSFAVITVLVGSVLALGIGRGILAGLFLLVALKALCEVADEGRATRARQPVADPSPGSVSNLDQVASSAVSHTATVSPQRSTLNRKTRRGRK